MKIITANRLSDGRVIYVDDAGEATGEIRFAAQLDDAQAEDHLAAAKARPGLFVNPSLVEVEDRQPSGRDRLKETIRANGPTVGNSHAWSGT
ncbi:DUF2849 domain-containing protein [Rhizobium sp. CRIBSB]|nr:DUF2849 domain-containing protein [Rhizobium sp. CRIBSB]